MMTAITGVMAVGIGVFAGGAGVTNAPPLYVAEPPREETSRVSNGPFDRFSGVISENWYRGATSSDPNRSWRRGGTAFDQTRLFLEMGKAWSVIDWDFKIALERTTDPAYEAHSDVKIRNLRTLLTKKGVWEVAGGDVYGRYSPYTIDQSFTGLTSYHNFKLGRGLLTWSSLFGRPVRSRENVSYHRDVSGAQIRWAGEFPALGPPFSLDLKLSYGRTEDDSTSISSTGGAALSLYDASAWSIWSRIGLSHNIAVQGEWAASDGSPNRHSAPDTNGEAWNVGLYYEEPGQQDASWAPWKAGVKFEEVDPNYLTPLGFARTDLRRFDAWGAFHLPGDIDFNIDYYGSENNILKASIPTTKVDLVNATGRTRPFDHWYDAHDGWRNIGLTMGYRYLNAVTAAVGATTADRMEADYVITLADNWSVFHAAITQTIRDISDAVTRTTDRSYLSTDVTMGWDLYYARWLLSLMPRLRYRYLSDRSNSGGSVDQVDHLWDFGLDMRRKTLSSSIGYVSESIDNAFGQRDARTGTLRGSLSYTHPSWPHSVFGLSYRDQDVREENPKSRSGYSEVRFNFTNAF